MMHRTGEVLLHLHILQITKQCLWHLASSGRSVWLLRRHGEQRLCAEHAFGQEAGLHDPDHAVPTGASSSPGEDADQKSGWLLDQQDGEQGSSYFYAQGLSWRQSQLAGKWWCLHLKTVKNRGSTTIYLTWIFYFLETPRRTWPDRGCWQGQGWLVQHLWKEGPVPLQPLPRFIPGAGRGRKPLWHQRLRIRQAEKPQALLHRSSLHLPGEGQQDQVHHLHWQSGPTQGGEDAWWAIMFMF